MENQTPREVIYYVLRDPITYEVRYVGKTICGLKTRLRQHRHTLRSKVGKWVKGLSEMNLKPIIQEIGRSDESEWEENEKMIIYYYRIFGYPILNVCEGGIGTKGCTNSELNRLRVSEAHSMTVFAKNLKSGEIISFESFTKAANSLGTTQSHVSKAVKERGQIKGFLLSVNDVFKQSEFSEKYRKEIVCIFPDGAERTFSSSKEAGKTLSFCPSLIRKVAKGEFKQYKKHQFKYV